MNKPLVALLLTAFALPALADRFPLPKSAAFEEECTSCHIAYPPQLLDAASWRALMNGLPKHFGTDASMDEARRRAITDFLVKNSGRRASRDANGKPALRISETAWFRHEHDEVAPATWQRAAIKSPANCAACHTQAAAGDYRERGIRIPK
ncbi:MAG: diheme cytochrome c [Rhodocyclales bacterium]|nr:diheme cytochrome c [Rhodocyclales bacterium]